MMTVPLVACAQPSDDAAASGDKVAATFGDVVITEAEVEEAAGGELLQLEQQMYQVKDQRLRQMIYERLVEQAAAAEQISREQYLTREIIEKTPPPSEAQIQQVMAQYRDRLAPDDAQARQQVLGFLQQQTRQQQEAALSARLFEEAGVEIMLEPPRVEPVVQAFNPRRGGEDAPIVLIEYTDFQCPYCDRVQPTIQAVLERYGDSVTHVFKHLPLPIHAQATMAAEASFCAADQGKFWELHDWLFANKSNISRDTLMVQAEALSLDLETFGSCLDSRTHKQLVETDAAEANSFGIRGTPGFVINGRVLTGAQPLEAFIAVIDDELTRAGLPVPGTTDAEEADETS
jgi:protein-disulfide isomerase